MTVPDFIKLHVTHCSMTKTAAVELAAKVTGQSLRSAWTQATGATRTPAPIARLLDIYCSRVIPPSAKRKHFPEVFS